MTIRPSPQPRSYTTSPGPTLAASSIAVTTSTSLATQMTSRSGPADPAVCGSLSRSGGAQPAMSASATASAKARVCPRVSMMEPTSEKIHEKNKAERRAFCAPPFGVVQPAARGERAPRLLGPGFAGRALDLELVGDAVVASHVTDDLFDACARGVILDGAGEIDHVVVRADVNVGETAHALGGSQAALHGRRHRDVVEELPCRLVGERAATDQHRRADDRSKRDEDPHGRPPLPPSILATLVPGRVVENRGLTAARYPIGRAGLRIDY